MSTRRETANGPEAGDTDTEAPAEAGETEVAAGDREPEGAEPESADSDLAPESAAERRIAELEAELASARDRQLRALAELENVRKRAERERSENQRYGGIRLARDLLSAHDSFERLFAAMDESFRQERKQFAEGVELIHREILGAFEKHDIRPFVPEKNDPFDPHLHQAMFKEPDDGVVPGQIVRVLESGFRLGDRLLRAARVSLAEERVIAAKNEPPPSTSPRIEGLEGDIDPAAMDTPGDGG